MKSSFFSLLAFVAVLFSGCTSERVDYAQALFRHVPKDPELLVLVRPNELMESGKKMSQGLDLKKLLSDKLGFDLSRVEDMTKTTVEMLKAIGVPWDQVESVGALVYLNKTTVLMTGVFEKEKVEAKLDELGFRKDGKGYYEYIYGDLRLFIPEDGLIMLGQQSEIEFLLTVGNENSLWEDEEFKSYRRSSPLKNTIFAWSKPPEKFLNNFEAKDQLGYVNVAIDLKDQIRVESHLRVKSPKYTVMLHDMILGGVMIGKGLLAEDPEFGPLLSSIKVTQDNKKVVCQLVIPDAKVMSLRKRIVEDLAQENSPTFEKLKKMMEKFN